MLAWWRRVAESAGTVDDIYYTVRASTGGTVRDITRLTVDTPGSADANWYTNAATLPAGRALLSWSRGGSYGDIYYAALDSGGNSVKGMTALTNDGSSLWDWRSDASALSDGRTVIAWTKGSCPACQTRFAVLDSAYNRISGPTVLANPAAKVGEGYVSVAAAGQNAVLTWMDYDSSYRNNLYYALVTSSGGVRTQPQVFRRSQATVPYIETSFLGFGNASNAITVSTISGRVTDGSSQPIAGVTVVVTGGRSATTDSAGNYSITDLPAGTYTVTPSKSGYAFTPSSRTVTLPPDAVGQDFTGLLPDLSVSHIEVNQGVQDRSNGVAGVAHKPASVRVYVDIGALPGPVSGVTGRLTVRQGQTVVATVTSPASLTAPKTPNPELLTHTLNFSLDGSYLAGDLSLEVTLNPGHNVIESNYANNTQTLTRNFRVQRTVRIGYVPIHYVPPGYTGPQDPGAHIAQGDQFLRWIYPIGWNEVDYFPMQPITWTLDVSTVGNDSALLSQLGDLLSDCNCDYVYGWLPASVYAGNGLGQLPGHVAFGNDTDGRWRRTLAHEVGHNLGARHTQGQTGGDPLAPDTLAANVDYGINLTTGELKYRRPDNGLLRDVMFAGELEGNAWVTPHFWNLAYQALAPTSTAVRSDAVEYLAVSGVVLRAGGGSLRPLFRVAGEPVTLPAGNDYCVRLEGATGALLAQHCFDVAFVGDQAMPPDQTPFNISVPWVTGTARVLLTQGATALDQRAVSTHAPTVEAHILGNVASWTAIDADGDPLAFMVLYSNDNGATWQPVSGQITATNFTLDTTRLPGGASCIVRVRVTDGVNTAYADTEAFAVNRKVPAAFIYAPMEGAHFLPDRVIQLLGRGFDPEDGTLGEAVLQWISDQDGILATGSQSLVNLSPGPHLITLRVTDSDGNSITSSVHIYAGSKGYLPIIMR